MPALETLEERFADVRRRVAQAAERSGRSVDDIIVVAVTKYAALDDLRKLIELGHRDFGESRIQQLTQRAAMLSERVDRQRQMPAVSGLRERSLLIDPEAADTVRWHMIGHVQRNKAKKLAGVTRLVHSVDSLRTAEELQNIAVKKDIEIEVLVQVNCTDEKGKSGCAVPAAPHLAEQIEDMFPLRVRGYMTMGPTSQNEAETRLAFERCAELFTEARTAGIGEGGFNILSMGMSGDYELAIECGANLVRIGSGIFGDRVAEDDASLGDGSDL